MIHELVPYIDTNFKTLPSRDSRGIAGDFMGGYGAIRFGMMHPDVFGVAVAGNASYHAAKWAVGGFTEAIAQEVAPFGVRVCALEPGGMRTNWGKRANAGTPKLLPEYEASVGARIQMLQDHWGHEMSDPAKVAQVILQLASKEKLPAHLLLGSDAVQCARLCRGKAGFRRQGMA